MRIAYVGFIIILIAIVGAFFFMRKKNDFANVHYHAGFIVYIDGIRQDYSDTKYMHIEVCSTQNKTHTGPLTNQDIVHLHDNVGDVAHVHEKGATWGLLLQNLEVIVPVNGDVTGYMNGKGVKNILSQSIKPYDSVIIFVGKNVPINTQEYITKQHIQEVEKKSENCN